MNAPFGFMSQDEMKKMALSLAKPLAPTPVVNPPAPDAPKTNGEATKEDLAKLPESTETAPEPASVADVPVVTMVNPVPDEDAIRQTFALLKQEGHVVEIRSPNYTDNKGNETTVAGFYDDPTELVEDTRKISASDGSKSVYWTLQKSMVKTVDNRGVEFRNTYDKYSKRSELTADEQVDAYNWLPLDFDPVRPAKTSSTDSEKAAALELAQLVRTFLARFGIPAVLADSGNGYHLLAKLNLPVTSASRSLIQNLLAAISAKFQTSTVLVDTTVYNPSRIWKVYGTVARKGTNTVERPWRVARIIDVPELVVVTEEKLRELLAALPAVDAEKPVDASPNGAKIPLGHHDIELHRIAGKLREVGMEEEAIYNALVEICEKRCEGYGSDYLDMCRKHAHNICKHPAGQNTDLVMNQPAPEVEAKAKAKALADEATKKLDAWLDGKDGSELKSDDVPIFCGLLSRTTYDNRRDKISKKLGWRKSTLDDERDKHLPKEDDEQLQGNTIIVPEIEPWHEPVVLADTLREIEEVINRYIHFKRPEDSIAVTLWIAQTHTMDYQNKFPYLGVRSPERECGKTTLLGLIADMSKKPFFSANLTAAAVFRIMDIYKPTLIIDELDTFIKENPEFVGILNSGHQRRGGFVVRVLGENNELRGFATFGPKAYGMIGEAPDSFSSRSIPVVLERKMASDGVTDFDLVDDPTILGKLEVLARKLARWVRDNAEVIKTHKPDVSTMTNRNRDNWRPLLVVAELAGGDWVKKALRAANLGTPFSIEDDGKIFLRDVRNIFLSAKMEWMTPAELVANLWKQEESGWKEWGRQGKGIQPRGIAKFFHAYGIESRATRNSQNKVVRAYHAGSMITAFDRFLKDEELEIVEVVPPPKNLDQG